MFWIPNAWLKYKSTTKCTFYFSLRYTNEGNTQYKLYETRDEAAPYLYFKYRNVITWVIEKEKLHWSVPLSRRKKDVNKVYLCLCSKKYKYAEIKLRQAGPAESTRTKTTAKRTEKYKKGSLMWLASYLTGGLKWGRETELFSGEQKRVKQHGSWVNLYVCRVVGPSSFSLATFEYVVVQSSDMVAAVD